MTEGRRAVGLARISNEEKRKERKGTVGHSIETQASLIRSAAQALGLSMVDSLSVTYIVGVPTRAPRIGKRYPGIFADDGGPSWAMGRLLRPALYELLTAARGKKFDAVVVAYQDRLTRVPEDLKRFYRVLKSLNIRLILDGSVVDDSNISMKAMAAEMDADRLRKMRTRTNDALAKLKSDGQKLGRPPIGLRRSADGKNFEADALGESVERLAASGSSPEEIALSVVCRTKTGAPRRMSASGVRRVLRNLRAMDEGKLDEVLQEFRPRRLLVEEEYEKLREQDREEWQKLLTEISPESRWEFG